jgi:hypothetical protein
MIENSIISDIFWDGRNKAELTLFCTKENNDCNLYIQDDELYIHHPYFSLKVFKIEVGTRLYKVSLNGIISFVTLDLINSTILELKVSKEQNYKQIQIFQQLLDKITQNENRSKS